MQNVLPMKNSFLFPLYRILKRKYRLLLPGTLFIISVTNRYINNTLRTLNWCRWGAENDLDAGRENEGWAVGVRDDGNVWVHGDDTGDRSGGEILDCS